MEPLDWAAASVPDSSAIFDSLLSGLDTNERHHITTLLTEQAAEQRAAGERGEPSVHRTYP